MRDIFDVRDRIVVITGGMGQLGHEYATELLARGARVALFDPAAHESAVVQRFPEASAHGNLMGVQVDVTNRASVEAGLEAVERAWGTPHGLINNAALDSPPNAPVEENGPFESYPETSWDSVMDVNVKGVFICCQVIGGRMARSRRGSIVNIASIYGLVSPDQRIYAYRRQEGADFYKPVAYSVSKSALLNLSRYLATYWGELNVRVNTLTLGGVFNDQDERFLEGYCRKVPLGRMARKDEYNGAIVFLLSDASSYLTGANLIIDGGWTAW